MLQRILSCFVALAALGCVFTIAAQPASPEERQSVERERQAIERERNAVERERAAVERQSAERERELARELSRTNSEAAVNSAELRRELAKAREQLAASAAEIARLSAQMTEPVLRNALTNVRVMMGGRAVFGLNVQDSDLGVLVGGVTPNGPAAAAGVRAGDTIVAIDDVELAGSSAHGDRRSPTAILLGQIDDAEPGDEVTLRVLRDGDYRDVVVEAGSDGAFGPFVFAGRDLPFRFGNWLTVSGPFGPWGDVELVPLTPALGEYFGVDEGLLVVRAGRAAELGLRDGDVIIELGGRQPQTPEHAMRILASFEPGESLRASIMRQRRRESLTIDVPAAAAGDWVRYGR